MAATHPIQKSEENKWQLGLKKGIDSEKEIESEEGFDSKDRD